MLAGFAQALFTVGHRSDFTRESDLAENQLARVERAIAITRQDGENDGEVGTGFGDAYAADCVDENVLFVERYVCRGAAKWRSASPADSIPGQR